jgi:hypothetical protein
VAASVQLSKVIRVHPIRHDRARELGAFANPKGRPRWKNSAAGNDLEDHNGGSAPSTEHAKLEHNTPAMRLAPNVTESPGGDHTGQPTETATGAPTVAVASVMFSARRGQKPCSDP